MKLKDIVGSYPVKNGYVDREIEELFIFSAKRVKNGLFFALSGGSTDGEKYIDEAVRDGAVAVVTEKEIAGANCVVVEDARKAYAYFSAAFYDNPQKKLKIIGVVGTNGKTTVCRVLCDILSSSGYRAAAIGTLGVSFPSFSGATSHTTPDPHLLYYYLDELYKRGAEYVVMEVSAHAIAQKKVEPIFFSVLVFTNCTADHLDYFKTFSVYEGVKTSIMTKARAKFLVVNVDDETGRKIASKEPCITYGIKTPSDVFAVNVKETADGLSYIMNMFDKLYEVKTSLLGLFNVYNGLAAACAAAALGLSAEEIGRGLSSSRRVPGRMERVFYPEGKVFVDYAHTPDGLEKSLLFLRKICKGNLYCLFGCGGNRDEEKRPAMGRVAGDIADFVVLTSDNPRYEDPMLIIRRAEEGLRESTRDYVCIENRKTAIKYALGLLKSGDCLLVAGKGAEEYQEIMGIKHYFSDKRLITELAKERGV